MCTHVCVLFMSNKTKQIKTKVSRIRCDNETIQLQERDKYYKFLQYGPNGCALSWCEFSISASICFHLAVRNEAAVHFYIWFSAKYAAQIYM